MGNNWSDVAAEYQLSFARLCAGAIPELVTAAGGQGRDRGRILDVGTGTGNTARALAAAGYTVTGVDMEPAMVEYARTAAPGIDFQIGALPSLSFPDGAFDGVVGNFVINHVPKPRAAIDEIVRVTRSGGLIALTIWPSRPPSALNEFWARIMHRAGVAVPPGTRLPADDDFDRSARGLVELLEGRGLDGVEAREIGWVFEIGADDLWIAVEAGIATIGLTYRAQDATGRAAMRRAYVACAGEASSGTLAFPALAVIGTGHVPRPDAVVARHSETVS